MTVVPSILNSGMEDRSLKVRGACLFSYMSSPRKYTGTMRFRRRKDTGFGKEEKPSSTLENLLSCCWSIRTYILLTLFSRL